MNEYGAQMQWYRWGTTEGPSEHLTKSLLVTTDFISTGLALNLRLNYERRASDWLSHIIAKFSNNPAFDSGLG